VYRRSFRNCRSHYHGLFPSALAKAREIPCPASPPARTVLHGRNAVASLKGEWYTAPQARHGRSPRQKCRGLIEGLPDADAGPAARGSPRQKCRGLIEGTAHLFGTTTMAPVLHGRNAVASLKAEPIPRTMDPLKGSPRQKCRGLIEGLVALCLYCCHCTVLHGRNAVASLKGPFLRLGRLAQRVLHGRNAVASLKATSCRRCCLAACSPRQKCRGLIEGACTARPLPPPVGFSTAEMPWPH